MIRPNIIRVEQIGGYPYAAESRLMNIWMDNIYVLGGRPGEMAPWQEIEENTHASSDR